MNPIIEKTYELIDTIDRSEIVKKLTYYKNILIEDRSILEIINKYKKTLDNNEKLNIKSILYSNNNYKGYIDNYNKLFYIIYNINNRYKTLLDSKVCRNEDS